MVPNDSDSQCQGERPIVLYAHGTHPDKAFNIADLEASGNGEGLLMAAVFAAEGYIVVAPNYVGYDTSTLGYHPYLNGEQQSNDMIDALTAARSALPTADAPATTDGGQLLVTGYSQGGYVAMATHRALQEAGETVTASAPMSGPYALSAFSDAIFQGRVTGGSPREPDAAHHELSERVRQPLREPDGRLRGAVRHGHRDAAAEHDAAERTRGSGQAA